MDRKDLLKLPPECRRAYLEKQARDLAASGYNPEEWATVKENLTVQPERTCETCGDDTCKGEPHPDHRQITCPDWQPKQPADTVQLPGEAEKVLMGDQYELIMSVRRLQDAHTREHFKGWLSPEQVEAKLKAERAKEAAWLQSNMVNKRCVDEPALASHISELEGKKHD